AVTPTILIPADQSGSSSLWLKVNDSSHVAKAWMDISSTNATPPGSGGSGQVIPVPIGQTGLPLYYDGTEWQGSYTFTDAGTYNIIYYTQDNQTNVISPAAHSVVYKPANASGPASSAAFTLSSPSDGSIVSNPVFTLSWNAFTSTKS